MVDQIKKYLEEYGWDCTEFKSPQSSQDYVVTYYNPDFDLDHTIIILIKFEAKWLVVSTHKLYRFPKTETDTIMKFLDFNSQLMMGKFLIRDIKDDLYINLGFELWNKEVTKENFFRGLDVITLYIDSSHTYLKDHNMLTASTLTKIDKHVIVKDVLETYP